MLWECRLHVPLLFWSLVGDFFIRASVQIPSEQTDEEHLHYHDLLTQHWRTETIKNQPTMIRLENKQQKCFLLDPRAWEENGGEQAMLPFKAKMLIIAVCSWLRTSMIYGWNKESIIYTHI